MRPSDKEIPLGAEVVTHVDKKNGIVINNAVERQGSATVELLVRGSRERLHVQPWLIDVVGVNPAFAAIVERLQESKKADKENVGWKEYLRREEVSKRKHFLEKEWIPKVREIDSVAAQIYSDRLPDGEFYRKWLRMVRELGTGDKPKDWSFMRDIPRPAQRWHDFFRFGKTEVYGSRQALTFDYISSLGGYLSERVSALSNGGKVKILDVASGIDVRFNAYLNHFLNQTNPGAFELVSTDILTDASLEGFLRESRWSHAEAQERAQEVKEINDQVRNAFEKVGTKVNFATMDVKAALEHYQPDLVICSWMPKDEDFTKMFRETGSVKEYVLVGPRRVCGKQESWKDAYGFVGESILSGCSDLEINMYLADRDDTYASMARSFRRALT